MPVTTSQARRALANGMFDARRINISDLSNGQFHGTELGTDESGVVGYIEVGNTEPINDAVAVVVGHYLGDNPEVPRNREPATDGDKFLAGNTDAARPDIKIKDADDNEITNDTTTGKWRVSGAKQETDTKPVAHGGWRDCDRNDSALTDVSIENIQPLTPPNRPLVVGEGEYLNLVFNPGSNAAATVGLDHSSGYYPVLAWDGSGL